MNILITGATGLIGRHLIRELTVNPSTKVFALTRDKNKAKNILGDQINIIRSLELIDFNELDVVINLAGEPIAEKRWTTKQKEKICQSRWQLTQAIVDKINNSNTPPSCFISGSAIGFYGRQSDVEISEDYALIHEEFTHHVCKAWEGIALSVPESTRVCLLRTGIVLDKDQGALAKMLPPFKLGLGGPIGNGEQYMSWIHIEDMVKIIGELINNPLLNGPINATAPSPVTNEEFSKTLAAALKRPCLFRVPKTVLKIMLGEMADLVIYGQKVVPDKLLASGHNFKYKTLVSALNNILE